MHNQSRSSVRLCAGEVLTINELHGSPSRFCNHALNFLVVEEEKGVSTRVSDISSCWALLVLICLISIWKKGVNEKSCYALLVLMGKEFNSCAPNHRRGSRMPSHFFLKNNYINY